MSDESKIKVIKEDVISSQFHILVKLREDAKRYEGDKNWLDNSYL